jgi:hypothetical protein
MSIDYSKAKIYKLTTIHNSDLIYYGSTINNLYKRKGQHKCSFIQKKYNKCMSYKLFELGIDDVEITLVESVNCNNKEELLKRERFYIENHNCVNKCIPTRTYKEYKEQNKDSVNLKKKEYYELNKDSINLKKKEYYEENKDKMKEYHKQYRKKYYEENKDKIKEKQKEYAELNADKIKEYKKKYAELNGDKIKEYSEQNKDKIKEYHKQYYILKKNIIT